MGPLPNAIGSRKRTSSTRSVSLASLMVMLACLAISLLLAYEMRQNAPGRTVMVDFGGVYYGARCALLHIDPYDPAAVLRQFQVEGGQFLSDPHAARASQFAVTWGVYLPSALFVLIPIAILPWAVAQNLWIFLTAALLALAALLMLDLAGRAASVLSCCLLGFLLANCELLFKVGNLAGVAVSLCVIAAWCFLRRRFALAGVLLLAISLLLKPHDAGFIWLYFLLIGGTPRKRALQTLTIVAVLGVCSAIWVAQSSPNWTREMNHNLSFELAPGGVNDPGPSGITARGIVPIISIQSALSIFWNDPHFYNPVSYLIGGIPILIWLVAVFRKRPTPEAGLLAIAAISILTLLPLYHRTYDAKLLLLTVPACALLWTGKAAGRWIAVVLTAAAILVTSDIPIAFMLKLAEPLPDYPSTLAGKIVNLAVLRPAPIVLLALGSFYLWACLRYNPPQPEQP
jgi:hypothetical protein